MQSWSKYISLIMQYFVLSLCVAVACAGPMTYSEGGYATPPPPTVMPSYYPQPTPSSYNPQPTLPPYNPQPSPSPYNPPPTQSYGVQPTAAPYGAQPSSYGQPNCKTYYETIQVDKCERYSEKVCYTNQHETCSDVADQNCNGIVTSSEARQCFNVTELKCRLQENVQYETVQAVFTVQKCHTVTGNSFTLGFILSSWGMFL